MFSRLRKELYYKANPKVWLLTGIRGGAKKRGLECTITVDDFEIPEFCPVLGIKLISGMYTGKRTDASPSIDRIDNTKGYIPGNINVISWRANDLKSNGTLTEFQKIVDYLSW